MGETDTQMDPLKPLTKQSVEVWIWRALEALRKGDVDFAEDLLEDVLYIMGRKPA